MASTGEVLDAEGFLAGGVADGGGAAADNIAGFASAPVPAPASTPKSERASDRRPCET